MLATSVNYFAAVVRCSRAVLQTLADFGHFAVLTTKSRTSLAAENLFLRKQLALFQERQVRSHRATDSTRWLMAVLSRLFDWRDALVVVKPDTLIRWHRKGFRLFWRWKSRKVGRPALPKDLQNLIRTMAAEDATWGEGRIANELKLKLGVRISPRTVRKYPDRGTRPPNSRLDSTALPGGTPDDHPYRFVIHDRDREQPENTGRRPQSSSRR